MPAVFCSIHNNTTGDSRSISCGLVNGRFSGSNIKTSSSGPDPVGYRLGDVVCASAFYASDVALLGLDPNNYSVHGLLLVEYGNPESVSNQYGGYVLDLYNSVVNGVAGDVTADCNTVHANQGDVRFKITFIGAIGALGAFDDGYVKDNVDGDLFEDNNGDWKEYVTGDIVATHQQVENLPQDVDFNKWFIEDEVIEASDGNYYDTDGRQMFSNLPSGVIPVNIGVNGLVQGSDGKFYDNNGDEILDSIPSGILPVDSFGDVSDNGDGIVEASDGKYYDMNGNVAMGNLPSGVTIVSYDDNNDSFVGSDGKYYDINGDEVHVAPPCGGTLLQYSNRVRLVIDATDIFGNQVNLGQDITIGVDGVIHAPEGTLIKKINKVVCRNLSDGASCGFGNIGIYGDIVGAKIGLDWEVIDIDGVLGSYNVANCVFQACNKYADIVYNSDIPLGFSSLTALDTGYYCMTSDIRLTFEGFASDEFPYCCSSVDDSEKSGGELGKDNDKVAVDMECVCDNLEQIHLTLSDKLDLIAEKVETGLSCICSKIEDLIVAINSKDISVTVEGDEITVEPSDVTVTNPVNNITVSPCQPVVSVTNPVNNINVQSAVPDITVSPCEPTIQNVINEGDVNIDTDSLVDKLDELFKKDDDTITDIVDEALHVTYQDEKGDMVTESITEVIKNKEDTNVFECIVEPVNMAYEGLGKYVDKDMLSQG